MTRVLPPLNGLRAFEASARHLSFSKAAAELNVTPAAISQQVKGLEEYSGVVLFRRLTRALRLTDAGQAALPLLAEGFDRLADGFAAMGKETDDVILSISVPPSFGAKWLVARLDSFRDSHPDFDVRIDATDKLVDFNAEEIDIAIRYGRGAYDGLTCDCLMTELAFPVCSPALLRGSHPLRRPDDLRHHTLLHVDWKVRGEANPNWRMWLQAAGVEGIDFNRGPQFSQDSMCLQSAIEGQGVALGDNALVVDDLASGRLVRPFGDLGEAETTFRYCLVYPPRNMKRPKVAAFRDWIMGQI